MSLLSEFREFAVKGNVVDRAVGVIIGAAFNGIVKSLVEQTGGELVLSSPAPGRQDGFEARIVLPVEAA